jgi:two-component system NtrC family sensor kinase
MTPRPLPSLRVELLLSFAILTAAALIIGIGTVVLFFRVFEGSNGALYLSLLIAADVGIIVGFGAYLLRRLVLNPLSDRVATAEAIATGDLSRRMPPGTTRELAAMSDSVNRMTERLLNDQTQLIRAEKLASVGRLAAGVAHEIGNPLGAINGYVHLLRGSAREAKEIEAVDGLEREASRIDRIVRGLLDYARPRRRTPIAIDINDVVQSVVTLLTNQGVLRKISTEMDLDLGVPILFGERHDLEQVFVNLLLNAIDAMGGQGRLVLHSRRTRTSTLGVPEPRRDSDPVGISVERPRLTRVQAWLDSAPRPEEVVKVVISDSGTGVAEADRDKIFDPFYTTKEPGRGTGLGLAIVARIVDNLQGVIWVERSREGGAAFHIIMPLYVADADGIEGRVRETQPTS